MNEILEFSFWVLMVLVLHPYLTYPLTLILLKTIFGERQHPALDESGELPSVAVIISAYNEEKVIKDRLGNCFNQNYPTEKLTVLVGSDGSSDTTSEIVSEIQLPGLQFFEFGRQGKAKTINALVEKSNADILIFSDANTHFEPDAIKTLVERFQDGKVGAVCGKLKLVPEDGQGEHGEGFYWKYETILKKLESSIGFVQGGNGAIYAIRREYFKSLSDRTINDDFTISMNVYRFGKRMVFEEKAVAVEKTAPDIKGEIKRHVRDATGHFIAITELLFLLNPFSGLPFYTYISHRILRWFYPFLMVAIFFINLALVEEPVYSTIFLMQIAFYAIAFTVGLLYSITGYGGRLFFIYYFVLLNAVLFIGFCKVLFGKPKPMWESTAR